MVLSLMWSKVEHRSIERASSCSEAGSANRGSNLGVKSRRYIPNGAIVATVISAALSGVGCGSSNGQSTLATQAPATTQTAPAAQPTAKTITIDPGDSPSQGPADAKVTIVEFSDFQGANCASFALQTLPQILLNYGDKIRFVFVSLVETSDTYSMEAAEAAECANAQGAFWPYHDKLFQNRQALASLVTPAPTPGVGSVVDELKNYAAQLHLDAGAFNACLDSVDTRAAMQAHYVIASKAMQDSGLGTFPVPAFFINGKYLSGAKPFATFKQMIDAALGAAQ
ncbi:MAG: thioredoxin domain-containing protein [Dehalococcoidia bacterium]|jgi:protein-disulfide isomerase